MTAKDILQEYATTYMAYQQFLQRGLVAENEYVTKSAQLGVDALLKLIDKGYEQDVALEMIRTAQHEAPEMDNAYQGIYIN